MKKLFCVVLLCFLLCGCMSVSKEDLKTDIDTFLKNLPIWYKANVNNSTTYYSYYLPSDMQEIDGNQNAAVFTYEESSAVMNLNIAGIVNDAYYVSSPIINEGFFSSDQLFYRDSGSFQKYDYSYSHYYLDIYNKDDVYLIYLICSDVHFYGVTNKYELVSLLDHLFVIARSIDVDKETVVQDYSSKDVIDYQKKSIDLFDYVIPSSGYLSEMVNSVDGKVINQADASIEAEQNQEDLQVEE